MTPQMGGDLYAILGVEVHADFNSLKAAYRRRAKECHPDLHAGSARHEAEFKKLVNAFDVLSDPDRRRTYDQHQRLSEAWSQTVRGADAATDQRWPASGPSIMDSLADDILEELIVGAGIPVGTTLQSLMRDLELTERFLRFREVKNLCHQRHYPHALRLIHRCIADCPSNVVYHYYLGRIHCGLKKYRQARKAWHHCLNLGAARNPPQYLGRIRRDLDAIRNKGSLFYRFTNLFAKREAPPIVDAQQQLIDETSRAMTRLISKAPRKNDGDPPQISG